MIEQISIAEKRRRALDTETDLHLAVRLATTINKAVEKQDPLLGALGYIWNNELMHTSQKGVGKTILDKLDKAFPEGTKRRIEYDSYLDLYNELSSLSPLVSIGYKNYKIKLLELQHLYDQLETFGSISRVLMDAISCGNLKPMGTDLTRGEPIKGAELKLDGGTITISAQGFSVLEDNELQNRIKAKSAECEKELSSLKAFLEVIENCFFGPRAKDDLWQFIPSKIIDILNEVAVREPTIDKDKEIFPTDKRYQYKRSTILYKESKGMMVTKRERALALIPYYYEIEADGLTKHTATRIINNIITEWEHRQKLSQSIG